MPEQRPTSAPGLPDGAAAARLLTAGGLDGAELRATLQHLMARGELAAAERLCACWQAADPASEEAATARAALLHQTGRGAEGAAVTQSYFARHPLRRAAEPGGRLEVLKLRCLEGARYILGRHRDGGPTVKLRGGHFSTSFLLDSRRIALHRLTFLGETPPEVDLPPVRLLLNTVGDADQAPSGLAGLERLIEHHPELPVINRPALVAQTTRDANHRRLDPLPGFAFPRTERFERAPGTPPADSAAAVRPRDFGWPLIVRETGTQTGRSVALLATEEELAAYFAASRATSFYLIAYRDSSWRGPDGQRWFNKKRMFAIDGRLYPVVSHIDEVWNVHGSNRLTVMARNDWMTAQERAFLEDPEAVLGRAAYRRLEALVRLVGLDWFGFDFTQLDDGTLLIFELNAAMRHSFDHAANFPYMQPHMRAISAAFQEMVERRAA